MPQARQKIPQEPSGVFDVTIIGAGAAGLMTAIVCRRQKLAVLLLDGQKTIGAKILMSGGTRCNVTNFEVSEKDFNSEQIRTVRNILNSFPPERVLQFFQELGVKCVLEPSGKYFPSTNSAKTVLDALTREVEHSGIIFKTSSKVKKVHFDQKFFQIKGEDFQYRSRAVVFCTGGLSYPGTGSDGSGYGIAKSLGHTLISTTPALTPLETNDADWKNLMGVSLSCRLDLFVDFKKYVSFEDPILFTHFGFSGPAVLNMSRHWVRLKDRKPELKANFLPKENEEKFRERIKLAGKDHPQKTIKRFLTELWPERFAEVFLKKIGLKETLTFGQLSHDNREKIIQAAFHYPLPVTDVVGYGKAEVTAGGVDLKDVDSKTLESRICPGLYFAGEILDIDGRIGGFNFQWAWSSAFAVGQAIARKLS